MIFTAKKFLFSIDRANPFLVLYTSISSAFSQGTRHVQIYASVTTAITIITLMITKEKIRSQCQQIEIGTVL